MADTGDAFSLHGGGGGVESPGAAEEDVLPLALAHFLEDIPGEDHRAAPAARAARVDILLFQVEEKHAAVLVVVVEGDPVPAEEVHHDLVSQGPQVAGDDQVIVVGAQAGVLEVGLEGLVGGRRRCKYRTIRSLFSLSCKKREVQPPAPESSQAILDIHRGI